MNTMHWNATLRIGLALSLLLVGLLAALEARDFVSKAMWFPIFVGTTMAIIGVIVTAFEINNARLLLSKGNTSAAIEAVRERAHAAMSELDAGFKVWLVIASYVGLLWFTGFFIATIVWVTLFLVKGSNIRWLSALILAVLISLFFQLLVHLFEIALPESVLLA